MSKTKATADDAHSFLLVADVAKRISVEDCGAFAVLNFHCGDAPEEWQQRGVEALGKFAMFGWTMFHSIGGLSVDWDAASENIVAKLKAGMPQRKSPAPAAKRRSSKPKM